MYSLEQFIEALDNDTEYDFIANHYWEMPRADLKNILLEYIYAVHCEDKTIEKSVKENVREELIEREDLDIH